MKTLTAAATAAALLVLAPAAAQAQTSPKGVYGTLGYANAAFEDLNLGAVEGRLGYRLNRWFGVEGDLLVGVTKESVDAGGVQVDVKLKHAEVAYLVGFLPLSDKTDILARVGYGHAALEGSALGVTESADDNIPAVGLGFQHHFDGANGVRVDYTRLGDADLWAVAYSRRF